jgi:hypothetical protein|tara:strand:+ start:267 stop:542 length:276 start_codon:yes stop_codon:yes gene_type:complete
MSRENGPNPEEMGLSNEQSPDKIPLGVGDEVKVERSNGEIEGGWVISAAGPGVAEVRKPHPEKPGKEKVKQVAISDLEKLNSGDDVDSAKK